MDAEFSGQVKSALNLERGRVFLIAQLELDHGHQYDSKADANREMQYKRRCALTSFVNLDQEGSLAP
jgi:hypothetical protein